MPLAFPKTSSTRQRIVHAREREQDLRLAKAVVWSRDAARCRICGRNVSNRGPLESRGHVHHVIFRSKSKLSRADTRALALVCAGCHADIHAYKIVVTGNANEQLTVMKGAGA